MGGGHFKWGQLISNTLRNRNVIKLVMERNVESKNVMVVLKIEYMDHIRDEVSKQSYKHKVIIFRWTEMESCSILIVRSLIIYIEKNK